MRSCRRSCSDITPLWASASGTPPPRPSPWTLGVYTGEGGTRAAGGWGLALADPALQALASGDGSHQLLQPVDMAGEPVAALDRADPVRGAGKDQIAGLELDEARQEGDGFGHRPDQIADIAFLHDL